MSSEKWKLVHDSLSDGIDQGSLRPGDQLPTEEAMARQFGVGRHSVRRAVSELARLGRVSVEQGRGTFVSEQPRITYAIGRRTRMRQNLRAQGLTIRREMIATTHTSAPPTVARALGIACDDTVIATQRISYADELPIAIGWAYVAAARFPDFILRRAEAGSMTATWAAYGITDYLRAETTIFSRPARPEEARALRQHLQMPVLEVHAVDIEPDGTPLLFSQVVWSAARVRFTVNEGSPDAAV